MQLLRDPDSPDARQIAQDVRQRRTTATAVMRACLDTIERLEPSLNTFVTFTPEAALMAAHAVDAAIAAGRDPGPMAGVPVSVKDLIAVGGVRQTFGSLLLADNVPTEDAPSVARLRAAGACIVGKSTTSELGSKAVGDSPLTGITRNPWNLDRTPGGSSAGAAAQVAAGMVPVALGTDGGGSIRIPASFCGLVGVKARFGRVPVWPAAATPTLAHVGPLARYVSDAALLLSVIAGHDARDPASVNAPVPDYLGSLHGGVAGLRVGWCESLGWGGVQAEVLAACREAAFGLRALGAEVRSLPPLFARNPAPAWNHYFYGGIGARLRQLAPTEDRLALVNAPLRGAAARAQSPGSLDAAGAAALRADTAACVEAALRDVDLLVMPTMPVTALPVGVDVPPGFEGCNPVDWSCYTYPFNLTGHPAASIPVGFDASGLPIGLQLVVKMDDEAMLLRAAQAMEGLQRAPG